MLFFPKIVHVPVLAGLLVVAPAVFAAPAKKNPVAPPPVVDTQAQRAAVDAIVQRMNAATARYRNAQQLSADGEPEGDAEMDAALTEMEAVLDACALQQGCEVSPLLAAYKDALKNSIGTQDGLDDENLADEVEDAPPGDDAPTQLPDVPASERVAKLLNDQRHDFDKMVQFNPAIEASLRRWLTDLRPALIDSYENYRNMRADIYPQWERDGLPEALLFGIMAKESNGKVHAVSRAGAAGPMQFMPATGRRFGLGRDETGFDTRYDPRSVGSASADYIKERLAELGGSVELALAAYNGGEGRALRVYQQNPNRKFWDDVVYYQFPPETRDYVPMVIAAAWLFLHPDQFGLKFPRVNPKPATLQLAHDSSLYELTICLGNGGTRDGFMRTLRNLNPRYQADDFIATGTTLKANSRIVSLYKRYCTDSARAELARALSNASIGAAIVTTGEPLPRGVARVGDLQPVVGARPANNPRPTPVERYTVKKGDTLGRIANRQGCNLQQLAKANGLRAPGYAVRPGQVLKLEGCK